MNKEIKILYQDDYFIACEKPAGILVHPGPEARGEKVTLLSLLKNQTKCYLYPLHRLDRQVSGIVLFGIDKMATSLLKEKWNTQDLEKAYLLLCKGQTDISGEFKFPLEDEYKVKKECLTTYKTIYHFEDASFCEAKILTGRRHQIRRHFARRQHNLIGDRKHGRGQINRHYESEFGLRRIFLHAYSLSFLHPIKNEIIKVKSPLTSELIHLLRQKNLPSELESIWK